MSIGVYSRCFCSGGGGGGGGCKRSLWESSRAKDWSMDVICWGPSVCYRPTYDHTGLRPVEKASVQIRLHLEECTASERRFDVSGFRRTHKATGPHGKSGEVCACIIIQLGARTTAHATEVGYMLFLLPLEGIWRV